MTQLPHESPSLRLPSFHFRKMKLAHERPKPKRPANPAHLQELKELFTGYLVAGSWVQIEETIRSVVEEDLKDGGNLNTPRAFTQAVYTGFLKALSDLDAAWRACLHYQLNRRLELEDRIDELERGAQSSKGEGDGGSLQQRLTELERYIAENPPLNFCGRWTESEYSKNSCVEFGGSMWIAKRRTRSKPQPDAVEADWQMAVRRGRDGKDAK